MSDSMSKTTVAFVNEILESRETDIMCALLGLLDANMPIDFTRLAWAQFQGTTQRNEHGVFVYTERRGYFTDV